MSAFGTKKRGGDVALQMTFPDVKASVTALMDPEPYGFVEGETLHRGDPPVARDFQQQYHEEKRKWANRNAMNWVHNNGRTRWLMNHNTYGYTQPHPQLSQRIFANPSLGNISDIYPARRTMGAGNTQTGDAPIKCSSTGLQGGILRTRQGQDYYTKLMSARIDQLNAIASAVPQSTEGALPNAGYPGVKSDDTPSGAPPGVIELRDALEKIYNTYYENRNLGNLPPLVVISLGGYIAEAEKLLFRNAVDFSSGDFNDALQKVGGILRFIRGVNGARADPPPDSGIHGQEKHIKNMLKYLQEMAKVVGRPRRERILLSNALLKTFGIGVGSGKKGKKAESESESESEEEEAEEEAEAPAGGSRFMVGKMRGRARLNPASFSDKAKFDIDQRVNFGDRQGAYLGEDIGEQVPNMPVPVPVEPDGTYVHPGSGYTRTAFPKMTVQRKPSNTMKVMKGPAPPVFQDSKDPPQLGIFKAERMTMPTAVAPVRPPFAYTGGKSILGLTKKNLPTTHEGFVQLAEVLRKNGHNIRVNSGAQLKNIRANFIRRLGL